MVLNKNKRVGELSEVFVFNEGADMVGTWLNKMRSDRTKEMGLRSGALILKGYSTLRSPSC